MGFFHNRPVLKYIALATRAPIPIPTQRPAMSLLKIPLTRLPIAITSQSAEQAKYVFALRALRCAISVPISSCAESRPASVSEFMTLV